MIKEKTIRHAGEDRSTIYFLKGLPASGKSTWTLANGENLNAVRVNKDLLREMMGLPFSRETEGVVVHASREMGKEALRRGKNVIVDDTNFAEKHKNAWVSIAEDKNINANLIEIFFDVSTKVCIERDARRSNPVGEVRILQMWEQMTGGHITDTREYVEQNQELPAAVIVDIDGTISMATGRNIYDDSMIYTDRVNEPVQWLVKFLHSQGIKIIFLTGRAQSIECYEETHKWLVKHVGIGSDFRLLMRLENDKRRDAIVKPELFNQHVKDNYNVKFVLDDRDSVVDMWRKDLKIPCFQVWYGDF